MELNETPPIYRLELPFEPVKKKPVERFKYSFIDLFAGIGGFRIALQSLGGECVFTSEWDQSAQKTYEANFEDIPFGDITKQEVKSYIPQDFDVLCAGFPCQAFSIAGQQKGFNDIRGTLYFEIEKIIDESRPKVVFLENVKNLQSHDNGKTFSTIINSLENKLGYKTYFKVLNTMEYTNIPQNRERIFIVAFDPKQVLNFKEFEFPDKLKLTNTINEFLEKGQQDLKYYYQKDHIYYEKLREEVKNKNTLYQWRRVYVRENKSNVCPTLTANMGTGGHNVPILLDEWGIRKLTPRECFNFQGFPKDFVLPNLSNSNLYKQAGNSVTVPIIQRIMKNISAIL